MLKRVEDWPIRLENVIEAARKQEFEWGRHDCARFVAQCVEAVTEQDFYAVFCGRYKSKLGAYKALKTYGGGDITGTITKFLGEPLENIKQAGRGDIVLVDTPEGYAAGAVDLSGKFIAVVSHGGLIFKPLSQALKAWKV